MKSAQSLCQLPDLVKMGRIDGRVCLTADNAEQLRSVRKSDRSLRTHSMASRKIGPFEVERQIGVGGMGIVYSAIYPAKNKRVALKVLSPGLMQEPKLLKRFEREIEILKRLNHPNIVKYYGGGLERDQRYYAMEFIDGGSLLDVLKKRKRLTWQQALDAGRQIAQALEHAHNAGIIHRDLKPANLFLSKKGRLKLGDFGIARDTEATALTAAGKTVGTYAYMAPEQIQAGMAITGRTDLYALGCLMYELIVGETPFESENPMDMLMQHLNDDPYNVAETVPECPPQLDLLIERLLAKDPEDRPYDALAVHTELGEIRDAEKNGTLEPTLPPRRKKKKGNSSKSVVTEAGDRPKKKKKKKKNDGPFHEQAWFLVTCLVALIGATVWLMWPHGEEWYAEQWREGIKGDEYAKRAALEEHIDEYLVRFEDGKYREEALELSDRFHAYILDGQLKKLGRRGRSSPIKPAFKAECVKAAGLEEEQGLVYVPAWEGRQSSQLTTNPLPAMQEWERLHQRGLTLKARIAELKESGKAESDADRELLEYGQQIGWLVALCADHHDHFRKLFVQSDQAERFVRRQMENAEELFAEDEADRTAAREIWSYFESAFGSVQRFDEFTEYAQKRLNGEDAAVPGAESPEAPGEDDSE